MKKIMLVILTVMMALSTTAVFAQNNSTLTPRLNHRDRRHEKRIDEAVQHGTLTREQARGLRNEERNVRADRRAMKADGVMTREERSKIKAEEKSVRHHLENDKRQNR